MIPAAHSTIEYATWRTGPARAGDEQVLVASKPGVLAHGTMDPPALMLAEWVAGMEAPAPGALSVHLGSGNGFVPAVAARRGFVVHAVDRLAANAEATRRTLEANGDTRGQARHAVLVRPEVADGSASLVTIRIPADRLGVQLALAEAFRVLAVGGRCILAGANDEGAKPAARMLEQLFGHARLDAQHSACRLLAATRLGEAPAHAELLALPWLDAMHWHEVPVTAPGGAFTMVTRPGVFSWEHLDEATAVLAETMRVEAGERVLDLGCGPGALGVVAARAGAGRVLMLDADADAVRCARETVRRAACPNAEVRASDVTAAAGEDRFDVVVTNPPFHQGKGMDLSVPRAFIVQAYERLVPGGRLYLVANRQLPYERLIAETFGELRTAHDGRRFKVIGAVRAQ